MNNDTPQIYSEGGRDDGPFGGERRDRPDGAEPAGAGFTPGAADAEPYGPRFGWGPESGSVADGDGYPQPSFYPGDRGYSPEPGHPRGPGYAPLPPDHPDPGEPGYSAGSAYTPDSGYAHDPGYPHFGWNQPAPMGSMTRLPSLDRGYSQDYPVDAWQAPGSRYLGDSPEPGHGPGGPAPLSRTAPQPSDERSDGPAAESLPHGKRIACGSG